MALGGMLTVEYPPGRGPGAETIALTSEVDHCPDRFFGLLRGGACRIEERDEQNNRLTIELPLAGQ